MSIASRQALALLLGAAFSVSLGLAFYLNGVVDWMDPEIAERGGALLLDGRLDLYAVIPEAQMGPLALLGAGLTNVAVYFVLVCALLPAIVGLAYMALGVEPRLVHLVPVVLVAVTWQRQAITSHLDDVIVLLGAVLILLAKRRELPWLAAAGFVLAAAGKPTAILLLPLVFLVSRRATVAALAGAAAIWLPFFFADPTGFLEAGKGIAVVYPDSLPHLLGAEAGGPYPAWVRPTELVGGLVLCYVLARWRSFPAALLGTLAFRALLEPGTYPLYWQSIIVAALIFDLSRGRRFPVATVVSFVGWFTTMTLVLVETVGTPRLLLYVAIIALSAWPSGERVESGRALPGLVLGSEPVGRQDAVTQVDPVQPAEPVAVVRGVIGADVERVAGADRTLSTP